MASELEQGGVKRSRARGSLTTVPAWQKRENGVAYLMMIPALVPFLLFSVLPLFWIFGVSFTDYNGIGRPRFVGLANYARVFTDADWWRVVGQTFTFAAGKLAVEIPLALTLAVLLNRKFPRLGPFPHALFSAQRDLGRGHERGVFLPLPAL